MGNISHAPLETSLEEEIERTRAFIINRGNLPYASIEDQLRILEELQTFEVGRFLLLHKGLNGYWTDFAIRKSAQNTEKMGDLEKFLFFQSPFAIATKERFFIFQKEIQKEIREGVRLCSLPCGVMADLLTLNYQGVCNFHLYGFDLDSESLKTAQELALTMRLECKTSFLRQNAWDFDYVNAFDLITSNGLNIYQQDDEKVKTLYHSFYKALRPGGVLVTSFLSFPPVPGMVSEWNMGEVNVMDALKQRIIFSDIIGAKWQVFRSKQQVEAALREAGFTSLEFIKDKSGIFPTVKAFKGRV